MPTRTRFASAFAHSWSFVSRRPSGMFVNGLPTGTPRCGLADMRFLLTALVLRAPGLMDEDVLAVDLVDPVQDDDQHEQRDEADREEKIDRVLQDRGEVTLQGTDKVSHSFSPMRTSSRHFGRRFLPEARIR